MAKINNIPTLTAYQQKFLAWQLDRRRSSSDEDKFTSVLAEAQVDLNPHQVDAALFAFKSPLSMGAVLADEVGLGKTIEAALVISQQWAERHRHILVIAPATLRKQWSMELEEKFFLPSVILESKNFNRILSDTYSNPFDDKEHIIICSYQFAKKQIHHIGRVNWNLVVLDEAHKLRNVYKSSNKTAIVLKEGLKNYKKLLLTATPLQNNVKELYGLISIIDDGYFGGLKSFNNRYGKTELRKESTYKDLRERIQPIIHRILRSDVQEYVKYTERKAMVQEYYPSDDEQILGEMVSEYLQRDECFGMPRSQRSLITLVLHKLLSSSTFAIAGTLQTIIDRLENIVKDNTSDEDSDAMLVNDLSNDIEEFEEYEDEWPDEEDEEFDKEDGRRTYSADEIEGIRSEIKDLKVIHSLALGIAERTIRQSGSYFFDDERVRNFVQAVLERMGRQDVVDEYIKSIGVETFDFNSIEDDIIKTVAYIWRINDYLASDTVILLHRVYVLWSRNWKQHSIISLLNAFFEAVLYYKIKNEPNAFNLGYTNVSDLIRRAKLCEGFESSRRLAVAYCYLLKNPPKMNADQEEFFMA